jgi:hypothetical protein
MVRTSGLRPLWVGATAMLLLWGCDSSTAPPEPGIELTVGQMLRLSPDSTYEIPFHSNNGTSSYLIGVQSVSGTPSTLTPVVVTGTAAGASASARLQAADPLASAQPAQTTSATRGIDLPAYLREHRLARHRDAELRHRQQEMDLLATRTPAALAALRVRPAPAPGVAALAASTVVGDTVDVKYPSAGASCAQFTPLRAVVRHVGTHAIWVEDVENPANGFSESEIAELAGQFDDVIAPTSIAYFGQPTDFDENGRIVIVITKEINKEDSVLGRVYSADFFTIDDCPASNEGEYFYGIAPDPTGAVGQAYTVAQFMVDMPFIIAHELTHVIQLGRRLTTPGATAWPTVWELEGQATLAEEVVGHAVTGNRVGQNYGFAIAWNDPEGPPVAWYRNAFIDLALYFGFESAESRVSGAPEQCGWLDLNQDNNMGPCLGSRGPYGVSWSFLRWLSDHYGGSFPGGEKGLHQALISDTRTGFGTISGVVGEPIDVLLAKWAAALYLDDRVAEVDQLLTIPSWNLQSIFGRLVESARLQPRLRGFQGFTDNVQVRAGSTAYFRLQGTNHPAGTVTVTGTDGGSLPGHMRVWVVRLQ